MFIFHEYSLNPSYKPTENETVVDIGSYIGIYSLISSRLMKNTGKVIAIEPNPKSYYWLKKNIILNSAKNINPIQIALGKSKGNINFYTLKTGNPGVSTTKPVHLEGRNDISKQFKVRVTTFDKLVRRFNLKKINLVKIDVEGGELDILRGATNSLKNGIIEKMIVEVHETVNDVKTIENYLKNFGYVIDNIFKFNMKSLVYARSS